MIILSRGIFLFREEARIGRRVAEEVTDRLITQFEGALRDAAKELTQSGFSDARRMAEQIYTVSGRR